MYHVMYKKCMIMYHGMYFFLYLYDGLYLYWITNNMYVWQKFRF
jgi:hypothetical protein